MVSLTDAERDSLTECECGHFANEHSSQGCLATIEDESGIGPFGDQCPCPYSPTTINRHAVEAIVAERERAAVERRDGEWRALVCTCGDIKPYGYGPHVGKWVAYLAARNEAAALVAEEREESW